MNGIFTRRDCEAYDFRVRFGIIVELLWYLLRCHERVIARQEEKKILLPRRVLRLSYYEFMSFLLFHIYYYFSNSNERFRCYLDFLVTWETRRKTSKKWDIGREGNRKEIKWGNGWKNYFEVLYFGTFAQTNYNRNINPSV